MDDDRLDVVRGDDVVIGCCCLFLATTMGEDETEDPPDDDPEMDEDLIPGRTPVGVAVCVDCRELW